MKVQLFTCLAIASMSGSAHAQDFDWAVLDGQWAESTGGQYGCRSDNLGHRFVVSPDKKQLTFQLTRKWMNPAGQEIEQYTASILSAEANSLMIKYSPDLPGMTAETLEWELRFIGPGTYRWRLASWPADRYNAVIGVKCD